MSPVKHAQTYAVGAAFALGAAMLGAVLAPRPAAASNATQGYTCSGTDSCHDGDRPCCKNDFGGSGHCSTYCEVNAT